MIISLHLMRLQSRKQPQQGDKVETWEFEWWMVVSSVAFFCCSINKSIVFAPHSISEQHFWIIVKLHFRKHLVPSDTVWRICKSSLNLWDRSDTFYSSFLNVATERRKTSLPQQQEQSCFSALFMLMQSLITVTSFRAKAGRKIHSCNVFSVFRLVNNVFSLSFECSSC